MELSILKLSAASLLLIGLLVQATTLISFGQGEEQCSLSGWRLFKEKFSKNYNENTREDQRRFAIFCNSLKRISAHNANANATYQLGLNHFSDKSHEELARIAPCLNQSSKSNEKLILSGSRLLDIIKDMNKEPPAELDWSQNPKRVASIRDQGDCGSCWAFAIVALLEGQQVPRGSNFLVPLSEQNMVDCDQINAGCNGGLYPDALSEITRYGGLMKRADYPYESGRTGKKNACSMDSNRVFPTTIRLGKTYQVSPGNETALKQVVASYGPVAVYIHAKQEFLDYGGGIYQDPEYTVDDKPNHGVVIVGYGRDAVTGLDYWKIKNSWSRYWGEEGWGYMIRNSKKNCGIALNATISLPPK